MSVKNELSWNGVLAVYIQNGDSKEALKVFVDTLGKQILGRTNQNVAVQNEIVTTVQEHVLLLTNEFFGTFPTNKLWNSLFLLTLKQSMVIAFYGESIFGYIDMSGIKPETFTVEFTRFERIDSLVFVWTESPYDGKEIFDGVETPNYEKLAQENDGFLDIQPMEVEIEDMKSDSGAKNAGDEENFVITDVPCDVYFLGENITLQEGMITICESMALILHSAANKNACKALAPEYKKAASILCSHDPPVVLAKVDAMEKFIEESSIPIVTVWNNDPTNHPFITKFFEGPNAKALLLVNFSKEHETFQAKYKSVATLFKGKGISLLFGDVDSAQNGFQYFGLTLEQATALIVMKDDGQKYLKANIEPDQIESWVKDYEDGLVKPFVKSEPIPEVNNEPVIVVVRDSIDEIVFKCGKNVLLEFYAPWCIYCKNLAPILDEVAISFEKDPDVIITKFDATANDVPSDSFDVQGFPTVYFKSC